MAYSKQGSTAKWETRKNIQFIRDGHQWCKAAFGGFFVAVRNAVFRQYASVAFHGPWTCGN